MCSAIDPSRVRRTPERAFSNLPGFSYVPRYGEYRTLRYAFIDEQSPVVFHQGKALPLKDISGQGIQVHWETYLCLHGQPTWSYLYRRMIPIILNRPPPSGSPLAIKYVRRRVLAPDYIGFGRSDKPIDDEVYTWDLHHTYLVEFVRQHIVNNTAYKGSVVGVFQDWGGILGLTLPAIFPGTFTHLLIMNTAFGIGLPPSDGWLKFRDFIKRSPDVPVGPVIGRGTKHLTKEEIAAYDAPHPSQEYKAGVRRFPQLVPISHDMDGVASSYAASVYFQHLRPSDIRTFIVIGLADPVLGEPVMKRNVMVPFERGPGCSVMKINDAGHFVQEWGTDVAEKAVDLWSYEKDEDAKIDGIECIPPKKIASKL